MNGDIEISEMSVTRFIKQNVIGLEIAVDSTEQMREQNDRTKRWNYLPMNNASVMQILKGNCHLRYVELDHFLLESAQSIEMES